MKRLTLYSVLAMTCLLAWSQQKVDLIKYADLEQVISEQNEELVIVNFWATWCGPCIKELPYFKEADLLDEVKVILVSVDFPEELSKVQKFTDKKQITPEVFLLDEKDYDAYMEKVSNRWSGAIPATLMISKNGDREFFEQSFTREELFEEIENLTD